MEHELDQQNDISIAPEKLSLTLTLENSSTDQYSAIKSRILNSIDKIKNKKRADLNAISVKLRSRFIETMISEFTKQNLIKNRRTPRDLDCFRRVLSISPEQEVVLSSLVYGRCNNISSQPIKTNSDSNETIPKIASDLRTPDILTNVTAKKH